MRNSKCSNFNGKTNLSVKLLKECTLPRFIRPEEEELIDFIGSYGLNETIASLKTIHDHAFYHSNICFDSEEKEALFTVKLLWEALEKLK